MKTIREILKLNKTLGDVGLEIEVEGERLPYGDFSNYWHCDEDGSLRGEAIEYVMNSPVPINDIGKVLEDLYQAWLHRDTEVYDSVRTGVHCHINVQELTKVQFINFVTSYYILEEVLTDYCGPHRIGNHFCLRAKDAEYIIDRVVEVGRQKNLYLLNTDNIRYAALNYKSLFSYGSLEFRAMTTTRDLSRIKMWAETLHHIKEVSIMYKNPTDIISSISNEGVEDFAIKLLGKHYEQFIKTEDVRRKLYAGVRIAQEVAYATNWTEECKNIFLDEVF